MDGVFLYVQISLQLLEYFITVLGLLKLHHNILKLEKFKWYQNRWDFVGMDVASYGTQLVYSKKIHLKI